MFRLEGHRIGDAWILLCAKGLDEESGISDPLPVVAEETGIHVPNG